jgi:hypothetical protein
VLGWIVALPVVLLAAYGGMAGVLGALACSATAIELSARCCPLRYLPWLWLAANVVAGLFFVELNDALFLGMCPLAFAWLCIAPTMLVVPWRAPDASRRARVAGFCAAAAAALTGWSAPAIGPVVHVWRH